VPGARSGFRGTSISRGCTRWQRINKTRDRARAEAAAGRSRPGRRRTRIRL